MNAEKRINGLVLLTICFMAGACATPSHIVEAVQADDLALRASDEPLGPPGVFILSRTKDSDGSVVVVSDQAQGIQGLLNRMEKDPLTLYWREAKAYTYSIGDDFVARYQPESSLTISDRRNENESLVCQFNLQGELEVSVLSKERLKEQKKACADLMLSFDNQLSD